MKKNLAILKKWYKLVEPKKKEFILQFLVTLLVTAIHVILPIPAAKVITSLTTNDFDLAYFFAITVFLLHIIKEVFWHMYYMLASTSVTKCYLNIQDKIITKFLNLKDGKIKNASKERVLNIISGDLYNVSELSSKIASKLSRFLRLLTIIVIVLFINVSAGIILIVITVLSYLIFDAFNFQRAKWKKKLKIGKDNILEEYESIVTKKSIIKKFDLEEQAKNNYLKKAKYYIGYVDRKDWFWSSIVDNWGFGISRVFILAITLFSIYLVSGEGMTLTLYLIIIPYVVQITDGARDLLVILENIQDAGVSTNRINTILDLPEEDIIEFGNVSDDDIRGELNFINVSYKNKDRDSTSYGKISNVNLSLKSGTINLIKGEKQSGKRQIFYLMNRLIKPDKGTILLDDISIYEYDDVFSHNVSYITYKPEFLNGSIMNNFQLIENNKEKIIKICKDIGLHNFIKKLPKGYNTSINENKSLFSNEKLFLLALARVLLTESEIICIYEFPIGLNDEQLANVKSILEEFKNEKTIVIFSATNVTKSICDNTFIVKRGKVTKEE